MRRDRVYGHHGLLKALRKDRDAELEPLNAALEQADDPAETARLNELIDDVVRRYVRKEEEVDCLLF